MTSFAKHECWPAAAAKPSDLTRVHGPIEIDPQLLKQVSGGAPRGGWQEPVEENLTQAPRGGWA